MFGNKDNKPNNTNKTTRSIAPSNALNSLVHGTVVEGKVHSESDIRVDGIIKGSLDCKAKVIIGSTGLIEGEVTCMNAMIEGSFDGIMVVKELLNVRKNAEVNGEITTQKLIVESGAIFNVQCKMGSGADVAKSNTKVATLKKEAS